LDTGYDHEQKTNRGLIPLLILLAALSGSCRNPFFADLLGIEEKPGIPDPRPYTVTFKLNDGTENTHAVKTVTEPATTVADFPANPSRSGYNFVEWNTETGGTGSAFTTSTTVTGDITVYAQWTAVDSTVITLNPDAGDGAFSQASFTVYKSGGTGSQTVSITGSGYTSPRWEVDGEPKASPQNNNYT
jgi:uncharacterized repeat protein (TIGR02543 family)